VSGGEVSGVDLARVVLRAALEAARKNGGNTREAKPKPRTTSVARRERREPMGLGAANGALVTGGPVAVSLRWGVIWRCFRDSPRGAQQDQCQ
jgi:hypothetical protein